MNELLKAMKVIRLKDEQYGQYLTASDNKVSVTLTTPDSKGWNPKNTEWRLEWLKGPQGLVGQVRLWSVYGKVLNFAQDPADFLFNSLTNELTQESWPLATTDNTAEWRFEVRRKKTDATLGGELFRWSNKNNGSLVLNAKSPCPENGPRFEFNYFYRKSLLKCLNFNIWLGEVVVSPEEIMNKDIDARYQNKCSLSPDTNLNSSLKQKTPIPQEQPPMQRQLSSNASSTNKSNTTPTHTHTPTTTPRETYKEIDDRQVSGNVTRSSGIRLLHDNVMSTLSKWQVGQVYLHVSPTSTGIYGSAGYSYGQYCNTGRNVNGSGNQKNGDVTVHSDINRSRDNNANFVNYEYA